MLGNDADRIAECLLRPVLVEQSMRDAYARDTRLHDRLRQRALRAIEAAARPGDLVASGARVRETVIEPGAEHDTASGDDAIGLQADPDDAATPLRKLSYAYFLAEYRRLQDTPVLRETDAAFVYAWAVERTPQRIVLAEASWPKTAFDVWWAGEATRWAPTAPQVSARGLTLPAIAAGDASTGLDKAAADTWRPILDYRPDPRIDHTAIWTGNEMIVWGGTNQDLLDSGGRYDPVIDTWRPTSTTAAPPPRYLHTAVWSGTHMLVWGGRDQGDVTTALGTGARYDPATDTWTPIADTDAPAARYAHSAVWTGSEMIVWGGSGAGVGPPSLKSGGRYDPVSDSWSPTEDVIAPVARAGHTAVWTGEEMIVFGENHNSPANGAAYRPETDSWREIESTGAPAGRRQHAAVWTGSRMIVWGGKVGLFESASGGSYDPVSDTWTSIAGTDAPPAREGAVVAWTGSRLLVWGGRPYSTPPQPGGVYDPATNTWTTMATAAAPSERWRATGVWSGEELLVWGGSAGTNIYLQDGARYRAASDTWMPLAATATPPGRFGHTSVWTGNQMIVWGGRTGHITTNFDSGGRYDPVFDRWWPLSVVAAPAPRSEHAAVWTGTRMIVWGGMGNNLNVPAYLSSGGLYDPVADTWQATGTVGAPVARRRHTAVWTGSRMVVWGGQGATGDPLITGGRYDPVAGTWSSTSTLAPDARHDHSAVWSGTRMLVWGGQSDDGVLDTGARYDPQTNLWSAMTSVDAPIGRTGHVAVWTGTEMVVWGGFHVDPGPSGFGTGPTASGGRYDPQTDTWTATTLGGAPAARDRHVGVWTGEELLLWGGRAAGGAVATGGRYAPDSDIWQATTMVGAPSAREQATAVWTGEEMIVWGGVLTSNIGVYHPYDTPADVPPEIATDRASVAATLQPGETAATAIAIGNRGGQALVWSAMESPTDCGTPGDVAWLSLSTAAATTPPREATDVPIVLDAPQVQGTYSANICIASNDPASPQIVVPVSIEVAGTWTLGPDTLPVAVAGQFYSIGIHIVGNGAQAPIVFALGEGLLPAGIQLDGSSGVLSGVADTAGSHAFSIVATDALGNAETRDYHLVVVQSAVFGDGFE